MPKRDGLDRYDYALLELAQQDNRLTSDELAAKIGLSATACQRRLKRLREIGIIAQDVSVLNAEALGRGITAIVEVTVVRERPDVLDRFKAAMRSTAEVQQCYYVTGSTDFFLIVTAKSMADYEAFTRRFIQENQDVKRFHTNIVMDPIKRQLSIPIDADDD